LDLITFGIIQHEQGFVGPDWRTIPGKYSKWSEQRVPELVFLSRSGGLAMAEPPALAGVYTVAAASSLHEQSCGFDPLPTAVWPLAGGALWPC